VDEALDASRQMAQGKSLASIRADIDRRYGDFGPGTDTPLPEE
jgi:hypothetical protein